jgi:8-oxo-dGTP diphosphatase
VSEGPAPRVIEVAAALIERDGRILIAKRPEGAHLAGLWEFPGGKREPGESFEACLAREVREELDVGVAVGEEVRHVRHAYPDRTVEIRFFRCRVVEGEPRAVQVADVAWVPPGELARYPFPPADAEIVGDLSAAIDKT